MGGWKKMSSTLINATGSDITIVVSTAEQVRLPRSELVLQCKKTITDARPVNFEGIVIPTQIVWFDDVEAVENGKTYDLRPRVGILYVVTEEVRRASPMRRDFLSPGNPIRDEHDQIIAYAGLRR
jgi:hypothetical protein